MVIMCMADTRRYGPICTYIRNLYWVSNSEIGFSVNEMPARVNAQVYLEILVTNGSTYRERGEEKSTARVC